MGDRTTAEEHGGQSKTVRHGIRHLAQQHHQRKALSAFLGEWAEEAGPSDPEDVAAMRRRYFSR